MLTQNATAEVISGVTSLTSTELVAPVYTGAEFNPSCHGDFVHAFEK